MYFADHIAAWIVLAQAEAPAPADGAAPTGDGGGGGFGLFNNPLLPLLVIGVMFYFLLIVPERKKRKELENLLNSLKKNDAVITSGGICGVVLSASPGSKYVTIRVDDSNNTRLKVLRSHIAHVGSHDEAAEKDAPDKKIQEK